MKMKRRATAVVPVPEARRMVHELEVHQAELEIQNEELRSARADTEAALARYTELFDFAPIGYAILSSDGVIREVNHAGARVLREPRSRIVGATFAAFVSASGYAAFHMFLLRAVHADAPASCEVELAARGVKVRLTATAVARAERTILLSFEDITERLAREEQLARTEQALREADRRKDEFLGMLSHELRNPLGPIRGSLYILDHVDPAGEQALNARAIIERQVSHLTRLVDDLFDVTRIARGKIELQRERVELAGLVRRTLDDHRASFEAVGIRIEARIGPGPFWLDADPARVIQIASNLLGNAERFTPRDGTVAVIIEARGRQVALRVRDTGVGIEPELLAGVFEPFAQAPQTLARSRGGLGLGLAMVKGLVELHGGTIQISSAGLGRGTEVVVSLPLADAPAQAVSAAEGAPAPRRRVLVIEDNVDAGAALGDALVLMGHEVQVTGLGTTGLDLARRLRPEVVICDLGLPGMDGYAVAAAFRADAALCEMCLIALSGYARPEDRQRAVAAGFDHHIAKPADLKRLDGLIAGASRIPGPSRPRPIATASDHAAASAGGNRPAAYGAPPSRRSSGPARLARRGSAAG
jgi:signal transduction histidine kinase/ActR/RegA family two-component response regulator